MTDTAAGDIGPEDEKLITLARASRARTGAAEGAAVRDETGRTYAAVTVELPSLRLTALQGAVAAAVSSEAGALEAAVVVSEAAEPAAADLAVAADLAAALVVLAAPDGTPVRVVRP
ncbi:cytidine deaminase [Nocardiopsis trehalosi]|uniref:cytidine deaminase n=1 Tax=Nocardiopsis trehalosi TaxID=109329 RepID=UPI000829D64D|nr:cytidine deaminase [Nocardiopsis trehalosi]